MSRTPPSMRVDHWCSASNRTRTSAGAESMADVSARIFASRGESPNCDPQVRISMSKTRTFAGVRKRTYPATMSEYAQELARKSTPEMMPIQCRRLNAGLTTDPAMCREGRTANKIGVIEMKNTMPPTHATNDKDMI